MATYGSKKSKRSHCVAALCENTERLFHWPKNEAVANKWTKFVLDKVKNFVRTKTSQLCLNHFAPDMISNYQMMVMMPQENIRPHLVPDALPTIQVQATLPTSVIERMDDTELTKRERSAIIRDLTLEKPKIKPFHVVKPKPWCSFPIGVTLSKPETVSLPASSNCTGTQTGKRLGRCKRRSVATQCNLIDAPPLFAANQSDGFSDEEFSSDYDTGSEDELSSVAPSSSESEEDPDNDGNDPDYEPDSGDDDQDPEEVMFSQGRGTWFDEPKVIEPVRKLAELLGVCMLCAKSCDVEGRRLGAALTFTITCQYCMHTRTWSTCEMIGKSASINALLAAAVLFTGSLPAKSLRLLSSLKVCVPTVQTLHYYQRTYLHQIIRDEFSAMKTNLWKTVRGPVVVAGDGRCDTAGHSAIYGLYSLMDCETNFILSAKLVKVTEVSSSNAMELEGLKRCHGEVLDAGLIIRELVTDRHKTVNAFVAKNLPSITHTFDPWHIAKGLKTKMLDIGKIVSLRKTLNWIKPVVSHVYHCAEFSPLNSPLRLEMWKSVLSHLQDIHEFPANMHYKECPHDDLSGVDGNGEIIDWLLKGGKVYQALTPVVHKKDILEAVMRASSADTAALESYHAELNRNAPKMSYFSYSGMQSRIQLTVMHHNENVNRPVIINKDGTVRQQIVRKKITKQQQTSIPLRVPPTYAYRDRMFLQFESYLQSRTKPIPLEDIIPPTLASTGSQLTREEVISRQKSRPGVIRKPHHVTMATTEANRKRKMKATSAAAKKILVAAKTTKRGTARKSRVKKTATSKVLIIPKKKAKKR